MHTHQALQLGGKRKSGKLEQPVRTETLESGSSGSKRLHIRDIQSGLVFLIDTDSDISLLPVNKNHSRLKPDDLVLFAANDSHVLTYEGRGCKLNLGLRRDISWNFCLAAVPYPIIGADLLAHYQLVPFLHESRLMDTTTGLGVRGFLRPASVFGLSLLNHSGPLSKILAGFPEITCLQQKAGALVGDVKHHILTSGPPVSERALRLPPEKLAVAKATFKRMVDEGICRPSGSPSPIERYHHSG